MLEDDFNHEKVGGLAPSVVGLESIFCFLWLVLTWKRVNDKEPDTYGPNSDCSRLTVTAVVVWFLGLVASN